MTLRRGLRLSVLAVIAFLPSVLKRVAYRLLFGFQIDKGVRIGIALLDTEHAVLEEGVRIGHFNLFLRIGRLEMGGHAHIGVMNVVRGGGRVVLGPYSTVMRLNVLNAIPDHDCSTSPVSDLELGAGAIVVSGHRIDFTDRVSIGRNVIIGGRNSSLWTHNRQETAPIVVGDFCYLGSEVRLAPGAVLAEECILGLGAVLTGEIREARSLVGGVPARVVRPLRDDDLSRIRRKTRVDIPDDLYTEP